PTDEKLAPYNPTSSEVGNPVHCVKIARDGLVYVCDRANNRIQVFRKDGSFVKEFAYEKNTRAAGSVWDLDFWIDGKQTFLFNADGTNNEVRTLVRETGEVVGTFGRNGRNAGDFHWVHNIAADSKGNLYTTEVDTGKRAQKFRYAAPRVGGGGGGRALRRTHAVPIGIGWDLRRPPLTPRRFDDIGAMPETARSPPRSSDLASRLPRRSAPLLHRRRKA